MTPRMFYVTNSDRERDPQTASDRGRGPTSVSSSARSVPGVVGTGADYKPSAAIRGGRGDRDTEGGQIVLPPLPPMVINIEKPEKREQKDPSLKKRV